MLITYGFSTLHDSPAQDRNPLPTWHHSVKWEGPTPAWRDMEHLAQLLQHTVKMWTRELARAQEEVPF